MGDLFRDPFFDHVLDDSHRMFYETCLRFARERLAPHSTDWEEAGEFPVELYREAGQLGLLGSAFPESVGGGGGDAMHLVVMIEAMMQGGSTGVTVGLGSLGIALPPVVLLGSDEQKQRFIPEVLAGRRIAALAVTEPGTGSDVAGIRTRAVRDGDHYVLNGAKMFITSGVRADQVTVLTRTGDDPHGGLTFFVVEKGTPGFTVSRALKKMGWWASDTGELNFEDCRVPVANRLGEEGSGFLAVMQNFQSERLALACYGYVSAAIALHEAEAWARERVAFGRPLMGFQVTRHKLARMSTLAAAARALTYQVAGSIRRGEQNIEAVSQAKNFSCDVATEVCDHAVQILGGMGYMRESVVERLYRDVRLLPIGGGTTEVMNEIISRVRGYGR